MLTLVYSFLMPESPRSLNLYKAALEKPVAIVARLRSLLGQHEEVEREVASSPAPSHGMEEPVISAEAFYTGQHQDPWRILLGRGVAFIQQPNGTNAMANYVPIFLPCPVGLSRPSSLCSHSTPYHSCSEAYTPH